MKRRDLLKMFAASAAWTLSGNGWLQARATGVMDKVQIGVIGVGSRALQLMGAFLPNPMAHVIAVCDVDSDRRAKAVERVNTHYGTKDCAQYLDMREMLARPDIDAVIIATPDHWHCLALEFSAAAGKHAYCEKPLSTSIPEGWSMVHAVDRSGIVCQVGNQQRSMGVFQRVIDLVRSGELGRIKRVCVGLPKGSNAGMNPPQANGEPPATLDYDFWLGPAPWAPYHQARVHYNWRWNFDYGGGQLTDWIQHHYDIAAVALGVADEFPVAIRNAKATLPSLHSVYTTAVGYGFEAHYAGGQVVEVSSDFQGGTYIEGENGWVFADRPRFWASEERWRNGITPAYQQTFPTMAHHDVFLNAVRNGTPVTSSVRESHFVSGVAHLANAAFRAGVSGFACDAASGAVVSSPEAARFVSRTYRAPWELPA